MLSLKILNSKEIKGILSIIDYQWGCRKKLGYAFLMNGKGRIFVVSMDVGLVDFEKLRINSMGLYFGEIKGDDLRLSIEGSQIIGPLASKNLVDIDGREMSSWLRGNDLEKDCPGCSGFVIIRNDSDFLGCGRYSNGIIKNFVPKTRRISSSD